MATPVIAPKWIYADAHEINPVTDRPFGLENWRYETSNEIFPLIHCIRLYAVFSRSVERENEWVLLIMSREDSRCITYHSSELTIVEMKQLAENEVIRRIEAGI